MAVRSDTLFLQNAITPLTYRELFRVPAGETWLVKQVCVRSLLAVGNHLFEFALERPGGNGVLLRTEAVAQRVVPFDVWWAIEPGCALFLGNVQGAANLETVGFGAKLAGAA